VAALAIAELSTTEAFAARTIRLPCRILFLRGATVLMRDRDAWVQQRCSAGRVLCAQLPPDSQVWRRRHCRTKHDRGFCRTHDPFAVPRLVFTRRYGAYARSRCVGAAALLSGARAVCTAASGFAGLAAQAIAG
jgi:hypothetical protein